MKSYSSPAVNSSWDEPGGASRRVFIWATVLPILVYILHTLGMVDTLVPDFRPLALEEPDESLMYVVRVKNR